MYRKKQLQAMIPWDESLDMRGVSISDVDRENGSPRTGDMIAYNPTVKGDAWLVAKGFFEANYEEA